MARGRTSSEVVTRLLARSATGGADLARMTSLVELLGRPDRAYPAIHVAGSDDTAPVARMISSLLGALGLKAGTCGATHLQDVSERVRVAIEPIDADELADRAGELEPFLVETDARHAEPVTFTEAMTALACAHFADAPVDVAVLEAPDDAAGGPTAVARGDVVVVGGMAIDAPGAGSTVGAEAVRHVGVLDAGGVVVCAPQAPDVAEAVARAAAERGAQLVVVGQDAAVADRHLAVGGQHLALEGVTGRVDDIYLPLHGAHQAVSAACALAAVEGFLGFAGGLAPEVIREGFAAVRVPGRLEVVRRPDDAPVVVDVAGSPSAAQALATAVSEELAVRHRVLVAAMPADADVHGILSPLLAVADHLVATVLDGVESASAARLAAVGEHTGSTVETAEDLTAALELASGLATPEDLVVVTGSAQIAGQARTALGLPLD